MRYIFFSLFLSFLFSFLLSFFQFCFRPRFLPSFSSDFFLSFFSFFIALLLLFSFSFSLLSFFLVPFLPFFLFGLCLQIWYLRWRFLRSESFGFYPGMLAYRCKILSLVSKLVGAFNPAKHKGLHQGWTQTSFYLQVIHFTSH